MKERNRFALLIFGIGFSNLGSWIYFVAINLLIIQMTGSAAAVAGYFIVKPVAMLLTNIWSGSLIDRVNIRKLMIGVDIIRGLLIATIPWLPSIWMIYAVTFLVSVAGSFFGPASNVYITKLIPDNRRQRFNSIMSMTNSGAFLLGPAISGLIINLTNTSFSILFNAASFLVCAYLISLLPDVDEDHEKLSEPVRLRTLVDDRLVVFRFAKTSAFFTSIFILIQVTMLIGFSIDSQEATYIRMHLQLSEKDYGNLLSLTGVGSLAGSFIATLLAKRVSYRMFIGAGITMTTVCYLWFYLSSGILSATAAFMVLGFSMSFGSSGYATFFQRHVPAAIMGRFGSLSDMTQSIITIVLTLAVGVLSDMFSVQWVCSIAAGIGIIVCAILVVKSFSAAGTRFFLSKDETTSNAGANISA
ncbi:MFS transporter [Paenibacillus sp. HJL G12]|uniref:MFS transporter n=1 Tax=Paenibacillus dendrobii TaxID=2691084 RepID=A0A7X3II21_9BACL|nr:MFS transporter [Paenibacillus dendrobii]MWV42467.1 MFS transporter [Paenibacillus dendrobii]